VSTKIQWTDETWNPVTGCTKISPGCAHCYADRMAKRLAGRCGYPADEPFRVTLHPNRLDQPLRWKKPRRVFVCSMGDLFHEDVPRPFIGEIWGVMASTPGNTFQILTKRPARMRQWVQDLHEWVHAEQPLTNAWLGVTAEDQQRADERIPLLLQTPAAVRFVSVEPMLGHIDLKDWGVPPLEWTIDTTRLLNWVIIGCESGPNRRPMKLEWAIDLVRQCKAAGVACFVKQLDIDGRVSHDPDEWAEELQVREYPC